MPIYTLNLGIFLRVVKLRHGTDGFTSPLKEGVQRIFSSGANPRTWVPKANTLPLDHRSRLSGVTVSQRHNIVAAHQRILQNPPNSCRHGTLVGTFTVHSGVIKPSVDPRTGSKYVAGSNTMAECY